MILRLSKVVICLITMSNSWVTSDTKILHEYSKLITNYISNVVENAAGKTQCASDLKSLAHDLMNMKRWALDMVDASGKVSSGILAGNIYMTGSFDQCLEITESKNDTMINGQYCTVSITTSKQNSGPFDFLLSTATVAEFLGIRLNPKTSNFLNTIKLHYGICIPHSCSIGNLQNIWDYIEHSFRVPAHVDFQDMMCRMKGKYVEPYFIDKYIIMIFMLYIFMLVVCTWYDLTIHKPNEEINGNYIVAFSLYTNAKKLFSSKCSDQENSDNNLKSISGLKVLCMMWIIFGHRAVLNFFSGSTNPVYIHQLKNRPEFSFVISASYAVDTFLFMSGLLLCYGVFKNQELLKKRKQFPVIYMYIYRIMRLSPALIATVLFYTSVFKKLSDGPGWPLYSRKLSGSCAKNWWATLLFVSNYLEITQQCIEQSWYIAVESQVFLISPILLIYFLKTPWKTSLLCIGICILSGLYAFVITVQNELGAIYLEGSKEYLENIYGSTLVRMPPYFMGLVFGFLLHKYQTIKIPTFTNVFLWISTFTAFVSLILLHQVFTRNDDYDPIRAGLFNSCARQAWALVTGSIVFLCCTGHGGKLNEWLSLPIFQVLVKLSYSVYLTQMIVIVYFIGSKQHSDYFSYMKLPSKKQQEIN
ncbi:nose resistant to fluoxetine protein 6 isoform X1 [Leptinotarsa decemlineata]|uniref:nose resistant to fluoxetine protein 6 isoform X1 n=1 Tax=Leptinotarsa decemlineata TaxID=7539 RepID=UPI003D30A24A